MGFEGYFKTQIALRFENPGFISLFFINFSVEYELWK